MVERENTLAAFRRAAEMGADAVELDVRRTLDGVLVVHHDPNYHPTEGAEKRLIAATRHAGLPDHVPTLGEALDACAGMWVNVEIKNDPHEPDFDQSEMIADETMAHLLARAEDERWLISCFRIETIDRCHALAPAVRTAWLCDSPPVDVVEVLLAKGHSALHPNVYSLKRSTIDACHRGGLQVNTWTCDDPARMVELMKWGIDGICTNVPDIALATMRAAADERA